MAARKKNTLLTRSGGFDRFQTAVVGWGYVPTVVTARFDPYGEPERRPQQSAAEMERVARVEIPEP